MRGVVVVCVLALAPASPAATADDADRDVRAGSGAGAANEVRIARLELRGLHRTRREVVERWTAMPIVRFGRGGGLLNVVLGFNDINLLGRYLELGGHWEYLGGTHSFLVWYRDPRFLNERLRLAVDAGFVHRIRIVHDDAGEIAGGFDGVRGFPDSRYGHWDFSFGVQQYF